MKFKIKNKLENLVGVLLVAAVLLAVVFTGNTNKGSKVVVEKEIGLLQQVKERGYLICGVNANLPGFSAQDDRPTGWNDDALHRTIQKGSKYLVHFYCNITFALLKTYWNIINFVNFCEGNDYPYLIFDGLNSHMVKKQDNKWILPNTDPNSKSEEELQIKVGDANDIAEINEDMIEYIENLKYYYTDTTMWSFVNGNDDSDEYHKGNNNHPNKLGAQMWAKHLTKVLKEKISE